MSESSDEEVVRVLYDYSYSDDKGEVTIVAGDVYRLIEKTNTEWWQVYDPAEENGESFFVPAQYVEVVSEKSPFKALSDLDKHLACGDTRGSPVPDYNDNDEDMGTSGVYGRDDGGGGEYVNLNLYREAAGINAVESGAPAPLSPDPPRSPQEVIQGTVPPPPPEEGTFVRVLVEGLPWDVYKEASLQRWFYVNRETGERMWKPPRKDRPQLSSPTSDQVPQSVSEPKPVSPVPIPPVSSPREPEWGGIPGDYQQVHDNGNLYFIHKSTQEKHREVAWEPQQGQRLSTFGGQSLRAVKALSTYGQLESTSPSKSSTLPANFTVARPAPVMPPNMPTPVPVVRPNNLSSSNSTGTLQVPAQPTPEETFGGYLNKAKIADLGRKKSKKNWSHIYVVLQGSNLVFYKDQKAASHKVGSPHGRPDGVISLQGAHVDFNPPKDITSKKNTILLSVSSGSLFLFHNDNEKVIRDWFTRMKIVANDVSPVDQSPREGDKSFSRSVSHDEGGSLHAVDKNKNLVGIRAKLLGLLYRRPTQEDLVKRGIFKDAVFGAKLHELCDKEKSPVPKFVHLCIAAVESKGLSHDGLYRVSGNLAEIQRLRCAVDKDDKYNLYDSQWDINVLTGSLKLFFRELKEPVFPFHLYNRFLDCVKHESRKDKLSAFKKAVSDLPRCNYFTLKELFEHLFKVSERSHENRMQPQNLAIVFGPTLMWQPEDSATSLALQTVMQSKIVEFLILEYSELFKK